VLEILTKRFSMEFAIRPFFQTFPSETLKQMEIWSTSDNYHVRRFASE
jgi:3-methyladenine DNA glycosylase AlkC